MINSIVIVSGAQQSDSAIHIRGSIQFYFLVREWRGSDSTLVGSRLIGTSVGGVGGVLGGGHSCAACSGNHSVSLGVSMPSPPASAVLNYSPRHSASGQGSCA